MKKMDKANADVAAAAGKKNAALQDAQFRALKAPFGVQPAHPLGLTAAHHSVLGHGLIPMALIEEAAAPGYKLPAQGSEAATPGLGAALQGGEAAVQGGDAAVQGGEAAVKGGEAAVQGGETVANKGQAADVNATAIAFNPLAQAAKTQER